MTGTFDGVPAGYETDDSWGCHAPDANKEEQTLDLEEELLPFLTCRAWAPPSGRGRGRGRGCNNRQQNRQIPVWDGYEQPLRPWNGQPYSRCTHSQRALHARAYRKSQRHYQV